MRYEDVTRIIDESNVDPKAVITILKNGIDCERLNMQTREALGEPSLHSYETIQEGERVLNFLVSFYLH